jgi:hypothetical protein
LGKFNSGFCWFDAATKTSAFRALLPTPGKVHVVFLRHPGVTDVIEAGSPAGWVSELSGREIMPHNAPRPPRRVAVAMV